MASFAALKSVLGGTVGYCRAWRAGLGPCSGGGDAADFYTGTIAAFNSSAPGGLIEPPRFFANGAEPN